MHTGRKRGERWSISVELYIEHILFLILLAKPTI